jgi:hypothetical protein
MNRPRIRTGLRFVKAQRGELSITRHSGAQKWSRSRLQVLMCARADCAAITLATSKPVGRSYGLLNRQAWVQSATKRTSASPRRRLSGAPPALWSKTSTVLSDDEVRALDVIPLLRTLVGPSTSARPQIRLNIGVLLELVHPFAGRSSNRTGPNSGPPPLRANMVEKAIATSSGAGGERDWPLVGPGRPSVRTTPESLCR